MSLFIPQNQENKQNIELLNAQTLHHSQNLLADQNMISIISDFSFPDKTTKQQQSSINDLTLKSDNLDYSADQTTTQLPMSHQPFADTQEIVMKKLRENRLDQMPLASSDLEGALRIANSTAIQLKENLQFVLTREQQLRLVHNELTQRYSIIKKFYDSKDRQLEQERNQKQMLTARNNTKVEELTKQLIEERDSLKKLQETLESLQEKFLTDQNEKHNKIQEVTNTLSTTQSELHGQRAKREHLQEQRGRLTERVARLEREKDILESQVNLLERGKLDLQTNRNTSNQKVLLLESQVRKLLEEQEEQRARTRKLKQAMREKLDKRDQQISDLEIQLREKIESEKENDVKEYKKLRIDLDQKQRQKMKLSEQCIDLQSKVSGLQNEKVTVQRQLHKIDRRIEEITNSNQDLMKQNLKLKQKVRELEQKGQYADTAHLKKYLSHIGNRKNEVEIQSLDNALRKKGSEVTHWKEAFVQLFLMIMGEFQSFSERGEERDIYKDVQERLMKIVDVTNFFSSSVNANVPEKCGQQIQKALNFCKKVLIKSEKSPVTHDEDPKKLKKMLNLQLQRYNEIYSRYQRQMMQRRHLHNQLLELKGNIRIMCRTRPILPREQQFKGAKDIYKFPANHMIKVVEHNNTEQIEFEFDRVFNPKDGQQTVYDEISPLITSALDGYNVCIMCYGQTGSGKTYTMDGAPQFDIQGIKQKSLQEIMNMIEARRPSYEYQVGISVIEIYNERIRDLLTGGDKNTPCATIDIGEMKIVGVDTFQRAVKVLKRARVNRSNGITDMNEYSSRSHQVVSIIFKGVNRDLKKVIRGRLNLIDLAGSERVSKTHATGERLRQAMYINKSLSALGNVFQGLIQKASHVPYRDSKLTHLLKESLEGDAKTLMIMHISPTELDINESVSTLKFAERVKKIEKGKSKRNQQNIDADIPARSNSAMQKKREKSKKKTVKRDDRIPADHLPLSIDSSPWSMYKKSKQ